MIDDDDDRDNIDPDSRWEPLYPDPDPGSEWEPIRRVPSMNKPVMDQLKEVLDEENWCEN